MGDHKSAIIQCRFNATGSLVASCDSDGVLKVWSPSPVPKYTLKYFNIICNESSLHFQIKVFIVFSVFYSTQFKVPLTAFCWVAKNERFFISGSKDGILRLHDAKENKIVWEVIPDDSSPLINSRYLLENLL